MQPNRRLAAVLAYLESLSLPEHAVAERQAIATLELTLMTPQTGSRIPRLRQRDYRNLAALLTQLKASNARVTRTASAARHAYASSQVM